MGICLGHKMAQQLCVSDYGSNFEKLLYLLESWIMNTKWYSVWLSFGRDNDRRVKLLQDYLLESLAVVGVLALEVPG